MNVLPPWRPRCVMVRGMAEALAEASGPDGQPAGPIIRLHPAEVISWGMEFAGVESAAKRISAQR